MHRIPRVSVVVPVYNPGPGFDALLDSLDRQSLGPAGFEVILCDDGSDETTQERLRGVAAARSNVRVLTLPRTGWPGTPRNHGIDAARGEYVFFADQDDRLFPRGLADLCDYADRHSSDVVIGKVVGVGRAMPRRIFRRDVPDARLGRDPLLELLTPHKLFRTAFLREHSIRFPDGRVRLEDHLFVMESYFRADIVSILASRPCYMWLKNEGSASSSRIDPATYFPHLDAVLDLVEENTEPGPLRDRLLRHWYRGKILKRLEGKRMLRYPDDYRERFLDAVEPLARRRFGPGVESGLALPHRVRAALLREGRRDELRELARFESGLECRVEATSATWSATGRLTLTVDVRVIGPTGEELGFDDAPAGGSGTVWRAPFGHSGLTPESLDARRDLRGDRVELHLLDAAGTERRVPGPSPSVLKGAQLVIDPTRTFDRHDPAAAGSLRVRVRHAGWTFEAPVRAETSVLSALEPSPLLAGRRCELTVGDGHVLELRREWPAGRIRDVVARGLRRARRIVRRALPPRIRTALNLS